MKTETIQYAESGEWFEGLVARPDGDGAKPAVLVCHAFGGRDEFADGKARELAELGYIGAAIDVYGIGKRGTDNESRSALMMPLLEDRALLRRRLAAAYQAVRTRDDVDPDRMGAIGFCFGGLCAIDLARMGARLRGVASFHGLLKPAKGLDDDIKAKILVLHGLSDPMVPPVAIGDFAAEMLAADADFELHAYAGVMHAFTNPAANNPGFGTVYDAEADARSWETMKRFFADRFV